MWQKFSLSRPVWTIRRPKTLALAPLCAHFAPPPSSCGSLPSFASSKALSSHKRIVHGVRNEIRNYVDGSFKCFACKSVYGSRLAVLTHLSDHRRPKCREFVLANAPRLAPELVAKLDAVDSAFRKQAQQEGLTHVKVVSPAFNSQGRQVGNVTC